MERNKLRGVFEPKSRFKGMDADRGIGLPPAGRFGESWDKALKPIGAEPLEFLPTGYLYMWSKAGDQSLIHIPPRTHQRAPRLDCLRYTTRKQKRWLP